MKTRTLSKLHPALRDDIGDLTTRRPLPGPSLELLDPFLFLNHHGPQQYPPNNRGLPFGPHPHRGFETVTFILEGELAHYHGDQQDRSPYASVIKAGGIQWMTAGRGLVHAELSPPSFKQQGGPLEILQLWVNLPARLKMTEPAYTGLQREQIPRISLDAQGSCLNLIAGPFENQQGPVQSLTGLFMATLELAAGARVSLPAPKGHQVFLYLVRGQADIAGTPAEPYHLAELHDDGDQVEIAAHTPCVLLFGHGAPLQEPVVAHGPFVMNTRDEIRQAILDYQAGRFGGLSL